MAVAIYPGSFDPITYGHIDIVRRARKLFDTLFVAVVANPHKQPYFTLEERVEITQAALADEDVNGIEVISFDGLLIDCARAHGADAIVRGLRANADFEYEFQMALTNRDLEPDLESVFFMTEKRYSFLASSMVKEVSIYGGDVSKFVPSSVEVALRKKLQMNR
jgi:pantetheine-phosphate adenylyltransferase